MLKTKNKKSDGNTSTLQNPKQHDNLPDNLDSCNSIPCEPPPFELVTDADIASMHSCSAVDAELLVSSSRDEIDIPPSTPPQLMPFQPSGLQLSCMKGTYIFHSQRSVDCDLIMTSLSIEARTTAYCPQKQCDEDFITDICTSLPLLSH